MYSFFHTNLSDFRAFLITIFKWTALGSAVGLLAGIASAIFLVSLDLATAMRLTRPELLFFLPAAGFVIGWIYHRFGGSAARGNNLVIDEIHVIDTNGADNGANASKPVTEGGMQPVIEQGPPQVRRIPLRMAPLILVGTVVTHLFGGSAGREGTAVQMGASLADGLRRLLRLTPLDRRLIIMAGISGGFGSVFGTPVAGFVFGMEAQAIGRIRYEGIVPCLIAAYTGDMVTRGLGVGHAHYPLMPAVSIDPLLLTKVAIAGVICGLVALLFIELTHGIKLSLLRFVAYPPLRPVIGGTIIIALTLLLGTEDYLGLSLPLAEDAVTGAGVVPLAFLLKLIFTAVTLGSGFFGGEVTPLFVIGSTLGFTLSGVLGVDPAFLASLGFIAVFAGASNTPIACALMGIELFGGGGALYLFAIAVMAYLASGHRSIYATQRVIVPKAFGVEVYENESLEALTARRETVRRDYARREHARLEQSRLRPHAAPVREDDELPDAHPVDRDRGASS